MAERSKWASAAPLLIGGAAIVVGLALGVRCPQREEAPPIDSSDAGVHEGGAAPYVPDLGGPDLGATIVPNVALPTGIGVVGDRLVWLTTEHAALYSVPLDKGRAVGKPSKVFEGEGFGGSLAADGERVCWAELGREPPRVSCLSSARLIAHTEPETIVEGGSPDQLTLDGGNLYWSDRGRIFAWKTGDDAPRAIATEDQRIAGLAAAGGALRWLDVPYSDKARGQYRVMAWHNNESEVLLSLAEPHERRHLWTDGARVGWAEELGDDAWELRMLDGKAPKSMAPTGEVTDLEARDGWVWWAEAHDTDGGVVTLLRRIKISGGTPERLGRVSGPVSALSVQGKTLFWSDRRGLIAWQ